MFSKQNISDIIIIATVSVSMATLTPYHCGLCAGVAEWASVLLYQPPTLWHQEHPGRHLLLDRNLGLSCLPRRSWPSPVAPQQSWTCCQRCWGWWTTFWRGCCFFDELLCSAFRVVRYWRKEDVPTHLWEIITELFCTTFRVDYPWGKWNFFCDYWGTSESSTRWSVVSSWSLRRMQYIGRLRMVRVRPNFLSSWSKWRWWWFRWSGHWSSDGLGAEFRWLRSWWHVVVQPLRLPVSLQIHVRSALPASHRRKTVPVLLLRLQLDQRPQLQQAHETAHRRPTFRVSLLSAARHREEGRPRPRCQKTLGTGLQFGGSAALHNPDDVSRNLSWSGSPLVTLRDWSFGESLGLDGWELCCLEPRLLRITSSHSTDWSSGESACLDRLRISVMKELGDCCRPDITFISK